mmetsp:Transcript_22373/g.34327  ORF Transcript_22373/g.34327 Transcript_22373/m.34327 type:complete len:90 (-) Transcript_22373:14-283(-)
MGCSYHRSKITDGIPLLLPLFGFVPGNHPTVFASTSVQMQSNIGLEDALVESDDYYYRLSKLSPIDIDVVRAALCAFLRNYSIGLMKSD